MGIRHTPVARTPVGPVDITARGWWDILRRTFHIVVRQHLVDEAGGVAFFALLALFPALAALIGLYGLFADPTAVAGHLAALSVLLPESGMRIIEGQASQLAAQKREVLGAGALGGVLAALWSANRAMKALFRALTHVHGGHETRGFLVRNALTLAFTLGTILFALLALGTILVLPLVLGLIGLGGTSAFLLRLLRWPLLLGAMATFLACVYRYGPCRAEPRWRWVSWGGAFAAFAWLLFSFAFSWFADDGGGSAGAYRPFGTIIGFMTWLWLSATVVLVGAVLNAETEHEAQQAPHSRGEEIPAARQRMVVDHSSPEA